MERVLWAMVGLGLVIVLVAALLGCEPKGPHWRQTCAQYTTAVGVGVTSHGPVTTVATFCIRYDSVWVAGADSTQLVEQSQE